MPEIILPFELILLTLIFIIIPAISAIFLRQALYRHLINLASSVSKLSEPEQFKEWQRDYKKVKAEIRDLQAKQRRKKQEVEIAQQSEEKLQRQIAELRSLNSGDNSSQLSIEAEIRNLQARLQGRLQEINIATQNEEQIASRIEAESIRLRQIKDERPISNRIKIVDNLETRFELASDNLEQVNTVALIDGLYGQEKLKFLGTSLRCEQWDYFCRALPNLLLALGLLGTFIGISYNLYNLSQTISQTETNADDINYLISQIQIPLRNMGIAFFSSLIAIACSSIVTGVNLRCNTNFAKSWLISSLEDYLDNIYKIEVQGDTRLDQAVSNMVSQQEEFLIRFHEKVGEVLETTIGRAANNMVAANQGFHNNVDRMVDKFSGITRTMVSSTNSFQESTNRLKTEVQIVSNILPHFTTAANQIKSASNIYLQGAERIEASNFSQHLESLTASLATTQQSFSQSTASLENQVQTLAETQQQTAELVEEFYRQLSTASENLQNSSRGFTEAAHSFQESDFANQLTAATNELVTIPQKFNESTSILHRSADNLEQAINQIVTAGENTNSLIKSVNNLNQKSTELLEKSDRNIQQEITSFNQIQAELNSVVDTLNQYKSQINTSIGSLGETIVTSLQTQTNNSVVELQTLTTEIKNNLKSLQDSKNETTKLITILENYQNNFSSINSNLSTLAETSEQQRKQVSSNLNGIGITSDRLLKSFEDRSQNNIKEIQNLIVEFRQIIGQIDNIPLAIKSLISEFEKHEQQMNSNINNLNNNISNKANQQINTYNQQIQQLTEKFNKII